MKTKDGGLNGRRHLSVLGTCFGPATDLVGSRRGLALTSSILSLKMDKFSMWVSMACLSGYLCLYSQLRLGMDATRISDGKPVMLKRLLTKEGPYELEINRLFSTEPLFSDPRNHCVHLLDVIELSDDPPIMVHPLLRPFYKPPLQTYGEFVTFFSQICEVSPVCARTI